MGYRSRAPSDGAGRGGDAWHDRSFAGGTGRADRPAPRRGRALRRLLPLDRRARRAAAWPPGFVAHDVVPPAPPEQLDWIMIARFADAAAARLARQPGAGGGACRGAPRPPSRRRGGAPDGGQGPAAARRRHRLHRLRRSAEKEAAFLAWQKAIYAVEVRHPGFVRHKIERPVPGVRDEWIIVFTFDSDASLTRWLRSAERRAVMAEGGASTSPPASPAPVTASISGFATRTPPPRPAGRS